MFTFTLLTKRVACIGTRGYCTRANWGALGSTVTKDSAKSFTHNINFANENTTIKQDFSLIGYPL